MPFQKNYFGLRKPIIFCKGTRHISVNYFKSLWLSKFQASPSPPPPPGICQAFVVLSVLAVGNFLENLCPGLGLLSNLLEAVNVVPFAIFHLKICLFR